MFCDVYRKNFTLKKLNIYYCLIIFQKCIFLKNMYVYVCFALHVAYSFDR